MFVRYLVGHVILVTHWHVALIMVRMTFSVAVQRKRGRHLDRCVIDAQLRNQVFLT